MKGLNGFFLLLSVFELFIFVLRLDKRATTTKKKKLASSKKGKEKKIRHEKKKEKERWKERNK